MHNNRLFHRPLQMAHEWVSKVISEGDVAVDATAGNGHDTLFLAQLVGRCGKVHVFDIQNQALEATANRLREHGVMDERIVLHHQSHADMGELVDQLSGAIMFNLGYLPGGDKSIISKTDETLKALKAACDLLKIGGLVTVVCYPGHQGGDEEAFAVKKYFSGLPDKKWSVTETTCLNRPGTSPFLISGIKLDAE